MCPLPGPTHQSLSRNMPLLRARSDFSPYCGIKATLPLLMERKRGKHRLFFINLTDNIFHLITLREMDVVHVVVIWMISHDLKLTSG